MVRIESEYLNKKFLPAAILNLLDKKNNIKKRIRIKKYSVTITITLLTVICNGYSKKQVIIEKSVFVL